ncbi:MAG: hypothetical protein IJI14_15335 [Anaerolineaceae bacterium]|nr:hypothetical protein [Anaerolineaceae bacterium]
MEITPKHSFIIYVKSHYEGDRLDEFSKKTGFVIQRQDRQRAEPIVENACEVFSEKYQDGEYDTADELQNFICDRLKQADIEYRIITVVEKDCYLY